MSILVLPFLRHQLTVSQLVCHRVFVVGWLNQKVAENGLSVNSVPLKSGVLLYF